MIQIRRVFTEGRGRGGVAPPPDPVIGSRSPYLSTPHVLTWRRPRGSMSSKHDIYVIANVTREKSRPWKLVCSTDSVFWIRNAVDDPECDRRRGVGISVTFCSRLFVMLISLGLGLGLQDSGAQMRGRHAPWASAHRGKWGQLTPWKNG